MMTEDLIMIEEIAISEGVEVEAHLIDIDLEITNLTDLLLILHQEDEEEIVEALHLKKGEEGTMIKKTWMQMVLNHQKEAHAAKEELLGLMMTTLEVLSETKFH